MVNSKAAVAIVTSMFYMENFQTYKNRMNLQVPITQVPHLSTHGQFLFIHISSPFTLCLYYFETNILFIRHYVMLFQHYF